MASIGYGKIIKRSFEIAKKFKWLWIYGLVLGASFSSGGGGSGSSSSPLKNLPKNLPKEIPKDLPQQTEKVLGETTNIIKDWFISIPASTWILLGFTFLILIILGIIISWILRSWAKAGLIHGTYDADQNQNVTLLSTSQKAIPKIKALIIYSLISFGFGILVIFGPMIIVGSGFLFLSLIPPINYIWLVLSGIAAVIFIVIAIVLFSITSIFAERLIVLKNYTPFNAWKKGLSFSKKQFIPSILMELINQVCGCGIGCVGLLIFAVVLGIPGLVILIPAFSNGFHLPSPPAIIALLMFFILAIIIMQLINAIFTVFKYSNWNLFTQEFFKENQETL